VHKRKISNALSTLEVCSRWGAIQIHV